MGSDGGTILVATASGIHGFGGQGRTDPELADRSVTSLARDGSSVWAILDEQELWHGIGQRWGHVADLEGFRATCVASVDGDVLVGTSEAHLFRRVEDRLMPVEAFDRAPGRSSWYTPWGGPPATRSIANWDDDVYVNVHVGGIPRTRDAGATWTPTIDIDADVHQVTTAEGLVLAACAEGLAVSTDRGSAWSMRTDGLAAPYSRAVAVCGETVLVSSSNGPRGGRAAVYRASLSDGRFERCEAGPGWFDGNIDSFWLDALPDATLAAFATPEGTLYVSTDAGTTWDERATSLPQVRRVLVMP
jgi:hypothetical protein